MIASVNLYCPWRDSAQIVEQRGNCRNFTELRPGSSIRGPASGTTPQFPPVGTWHQRKLPLFLSIYPGLDLCIKRDTILPNESEMDQTQRHTLFASLPVTYFSNMASI
jgi:hypothetical protein